MSSPGGGASIRARARRRPRGANEREEARPGRGRPPPLGARASGAALGGALALACATAHADGDGAYGRLDGDVELHAGAGVALEAGGPALAANAALLYLGTAGVYGHYLDALGNDAAPSRRSIAAGLLLRPLFLARYASDLEHGPARLDLMLDSVAFGVGTFWEAARSAPSATASRASEGDPGLEIGLGIGLPIISAATGPWLDLRGALRWRAIDLGAGGSPDVVDRGAALSLVLAWHHVVAAHLVDAGDALRR